MKDLPVLFVNEYEDISLELLESTLEYFKDSEFNFDKLNIDYWLDKKTENQENLNNIKKVNFITLLLKILINLVDILKVRKNNSLLLKKNN